MILIENLSWAEWNESQLPGAHGMPAYVNRHLDHVPIHDGYWKDMLVNAPGGIPDACSPEEIGFGHKRTHHDDTKVTYNFLIPEDDNNTPPASQKANLKSAGNETSRDNGLLYGEMWRDARVSDTAPRASINLNESDADVWHWPSDGRIAEDLKEAAAVRKFRPAHDVSDILGSFKETTEDHKSGLKQVAATIQTENVFTYDLPTRRTKGLERSVLRGGSSPGTSREYSNITTYEGFLAPEAGNELVDPRPKVAGDPAKQRNTFCSSLHGVQDKRRSLAAAEFSNQRAASEAEKVSLPSILAKSTRNCLTTFSQPDTWESRRRGKARGDDLAFEDHVTMEAGYLCGTALTGPRSCGPDDNITELIRMKPEDEMFAVIPGRVRAQDGGSCDGLFTDWPQHQLCRPQSMRMPRLSAQAHMSHHPLTQHDASGCSLRLQEAGHQERQESHSAQPHQISSAEPQQQQSPHLEQSHTSQPQHASPRRVEEFANALQISLPQTCGAGQCRDIAGLSGAADDAHSHTTAGLRAISKDDRSGGAFPGLSAATEQMPISTTRQDIALEAPTRNRSPLPPFDHNHAEHIPSQPERKCCQC